MSRPHLAVVEEEGGMGFSEEAAALLDSAVEAENVEDERGKGKDEIFGVGGFVA